MEKGTFCDLSHIMRKPVFRVSDQDLGSRGIVPSMLQKIKGVISCTVQLICAFVFANVHSSPLPQGRIKVNVLFTCGLVFLFGFSNQSRLFHSF